MSRLMQFVIATQVMEALGFDTDTALALASGDTIWLRSVPPQHWLYPTASIEPHYFWLSLYYSWCVAVPWEAED